MKKDTLATISEESDGTATSCKDKLSQIDGKEKSSTDNSDAENKAEEATSKATSEDSDRDQNLVENGSGNDADDENKDDNDDQDDDDVIKEAGTSLKLGESDIDVSETSKE